MITDRNLARKRLLHRIPAQAFITNQVTGSSTHLSAFEDGDALFQEFSNFGFGGFDVAAAGDSVTALVVDFLHKVDVTKEIGVRVLFGADATPAAGDAVTWLVTYSQADPGEALSAPSVALNTVIAAHTPGHTTASRLERTARGIINANTFDETAKLGVLGVNVEADALTDYGANEVVFLALEFDYMPHELKKAALNENDNVHTSQSAS